MVRINIMEHNEYLEQKARSKSARMKQVCQRNRGAGKLVWSLVKDETFAKSKAGRHFLQHLGSRCSSLGVRP